MRRPSAALRPWPAARRRSSTVGDAARDRQRGRASNESAAVPPARAKSGRRADAMKIGSIAIVEIAEYGEVCPAASCRAAAPSAGSQPACRSHGQQGSRSPISPMPQLSARPHRKQRNVHARVASTHVSSPSRRPMRARPSSNTSRRRQQTQHEIRFAIEIEEVAGMHQHFASSSRRRTSDSSDRIAGTRRTADQPPSGIVSAHRRMRCAPGLERSQIAREPRRQSRRESLRQRASSARGRQLHGRRDRQIRVGDNLQPRHRFGSLVVRARHGDPAPASSAAGRRISTGRRA